MPSLSYGQPLPPKTASIKIRRNLSLSKYPTTIDPSAEVKAAAPRKLTFPSIMNFNRINLPIEGLTEKITNMSTPVDKKGVPIDDDELGVLQTKETTNFVDRRRTIWKLAQSVKQGEDSLLDLDNMIKEEGDVLNEKIHQIFSLQ